MSENRTNIAPNSRSSDTNIVTSRSDCSNRLPPAPYIPTSLLQPSDISPTIALIRYQTEKFKNLRLKPKQ